METWEEVRSISGRGIVRLVNQAVCSMVYMTREMFACTGICDLVFEPCIAQYAVIPSGPNNRIVAGVTAIYELLSIRPPHQKVTTSTLDLQRHRHHHHHL
jgi:hypothetical protein